MELFTLYTILSGFNKLYNYINSPLVTSKNCYS